ncbi:hypothetical protein BCR33DRAFT_19868 [Rhizoclosmatium globosum]|uniref:Uncharacterized protein n=1 Tax=Rhizoclosmatium globosum TaxID=329046 RepID=A0A1Y2CQ38_9FUNG|nr:hypothetical protein BCR33DRAFT_19868 [Rhizoclosmatium globosum]|eukprot:ORY49150.1 hypothetical protein BCR33DRAFT_19868 [Rhizoclosmatium globosum]
MNRLERTFGTPSILTLLPSMIDHVLEQRYVPTTTQYIDAVIKVAKGRNVLCKFLSGMLKALNHLVSGKWELFCTQAQSLVQQSNGEPFLTDYLQKLFEFKIRKVRAVRSSNAKNNLGLKEQVSVLVRFFRNHNYKWDDKNATTLLDYLREV